MSRKIKIVISFILISLVYFSSYYISLNKLGEIKEIDRATIIRDSERVKEETKVILINRYLKSGEEKEIELPLDKKVVGLDMEGVRNYFSEYKIIEASSNKIILLKEHLTYSPEKYFLNIEGDKLTIYYIDKDLKEKKVKDTDVLINFLNEGDISSLNEGNIRYQFNSIIEALESLEDYV